MPRCMCFSIILSVALLIVTAAGGGARAAPGTETPPEASPTDTPAATLTPPGLPATATPTATPAPPTATATAENTPTATPTVTSTSAPTPTITATPTPLPACAAGGATLTITVDNQTGVPQPVTFTETALTASCFGGTTSFTASTICAEGSTECLAVPGLVSGVWRHQISVGLQNQYQKSIIVAADPNGTANAIFWVAFKTVLTVDRTDDVSSDPTPQCPSVPGTHTCTLRQAMMAGVTAPAPLLVQFDPAVFPAGTPTAVQLTQSANLPIAGYRIMVDGTDPNGDPTFRGDPYNRIVVLPPRGATIDFSNQWAAVVGLFLQRPTLADRARPYDMILFDGTGGMTQQNRVVNCKLDGGGGNLTVKSVGQDCIEGSGGAGTNWSAANLVQNTEVTGCPDKGVKATTLAFLVVRDSWVHHNIGGGIQATLSGNIEADRNVIEYSGYNTAAQVFPDANGLSANGANASVSPTTPNTPSVLQTNGNIIRYSSSRGISVQGLSTASIGNDLSCGAMNRGTNAQNGIAIIEAVGAVPAVTVRGTTTVYNGRSGAAINGQGTADFGDGSLDPGNNAFTQNATNGGLGGHNFDNSSGQTGVPAIGDQWQHCYADSQHPAGTCDGDIGLDVSGPVNFEPPQPNRTDASSLPLVVQGFSPTKAKAGDLVHINGSGFDAISGYPTGGDCTTTIEQNNACDTPTGGNCVQYEVSPGVWVDLPVQSVTPTEIIVQLPPAITCSQPVNIRVQRIDYTGAPVTATQVFCTNPTIPAPRATATPTTLSSETPTATLTISQTAVPTATPTMNETPTALPSVTPTATPTGTAPPTTTQTPTLVPTPTPTRTPVPCVGDCNDSGGVTIEDLLTMVNIALGNVPVSNCTAGDPNRDHQVTVDEILAAVTNALEGCR